MCDNTVIFCGVLCGFRLLVEETLNKLREVEGRSCSDKSYFFDKICMFPHGHRLGCYGTLSCAIHMHSLE